MEEIWKDIKGYEGLYQVSNLGNVRRLLFNKNKTNIIKTRNLKINNTNNYSYSVLCKNGNVKNFSVHRLVAQAFIPNSDNLPQVNHKDENKHNNCVDNLEWCTSLYNMNYGKVKEKISKSRQNKPNYKKRKKVIQYDKNMMFLKKYNGICEATQQTNINGKSIIDCCKGKQKTAGGFIWEYV